MLEEKYMNPKTLRLTHFQKMVLRILHDVENPKVAAEQLSTGPDKANLKSAAVMLNKYGLIDYDGYESSLTDSGMSAIEEYNIANDPSLVADKDSAPQAGGEEIGSKSELGPTMGDEEPEIDPENDPLSAPQDTKDDIKLESLNLIRSINNKLLEERLLKSLKN